tara:strand:+ start:2311 stop:2715 length:405 start_codon:yes stop_codon:yes gene_type:complete
MYSFKNNIRVRYSETDKMGFVYYGIYAQYYEVGRVELLRSLGVVYKDLEERGFLLPVVKFSISYKRPAFYDDLLTIYTSIKELSSVSIKFDYKILNSKSELLNTGEVKLAIVNKDTSKSCSFPDDILEKLAKYT